MSVHVGKSSWFVHWDTCVPCLIERFRKEQKSKGAGVVLSQMLPHCTRFLQLGLTQSVQGKCLFRVSHEKEEALEVGGATEGVGRESRSRENVFTGHKLALCHVHLLFPVSDK